MRLADVDVLRQVTGRGFRHATDPHSSGPENPEQTIAALAVILRSRDRDGTIKEITQYEEHVTSGFARGHAPP
jgi:hypothetical protein